MKSRKVLLGFASFGAIAMGCGPAWGAGEAQPGLPNESVIEEVVVTASKRAERISEVPMSVASASGEQLRAAGVADTAGLERVVPGLTYQQSTYGAPVFTLRGIGFYDTTLAASPAVSVYVDQAPLPFSAMTRGAVLDLERVEVLKGPQGTLFGQNSTGGAVNYIAAKPTKFPVAGGQVSYGRFGEFNAEGYLGGPISESLAGRIAVRSEQRGDWQKSATRTDTLGQKNYINGRFLVDWAPSDSLRIEGTVGGWVDKSDTQAAQFQGVSPVVPGSPPVEALRSYPLAGERARIADWDPGRSYARDDKFYHLGLRGDWDVAAGVTVTSVTGFSDYRSRAPSDVDGTAYRDLFITVLGDIESFSQELRVAGGAGGLKWLAGASYQRDAADETDRAQTGSSSNSIGPFTFDSLDNINRQRIETTAAFGSIDLGLYDGLKAHVSARFTDSDNHFAGCSRDPGNGQLAAALSFLSTLASGSPTTIAPGACVSLGSDGKPISSAGGLVTSRLHERNLSWRTGLDWKPRDGFLVYANVTRGYKAGGFPTLAAAFASELGAITEESVLAYELGFKALVRRNLQVDGALFYYDYRDKQILGFELVPPFGYLPRLVNIPKSRVGGAELSLRWQPITPLRIALAGSYTASKVQRDPPNAIDAFGVSTTFMGEQFPNAPKLQLSGDAEWRLALADDWSAFVGLNVSYRSGAYAAFGQSPSLHIDSYGLLNLRAGVTPRWGGAAFEVWVRNVTNEYYANNLNHVADTLARSSGMPVTYGVAFRYDLK